MNTIKTIVWIIVIIIVLGIIKMFFFSVPKKDGAGLGGPIKGGEMPPVLVNVFIPVSQELNNEVFATGSILANEEVILMPETAGKVTRLHINEGSEVKKGELLVKINDSDLQAQLKKLELQAKIADDQVNRQKQLLAISGISQEEYDIILNQFNTIKADIDYVKAQITKTEIRSPFNGVVGLKYISEGSYVNNATRIASVQQLNAVKIDFSVPEKYSDVIRKNDVITFTVSDNNKIYKAKVYAIEPKIDMSTRTVQLRAIADNKGDLFPGAFTKIKLPLQTIKDAVMIPTEAIIPILKGKKVFVCKNGKATEVKVQTGIRTDALIQIVSGIQAGDSVITTGIMQLKPDAPVKVIQKK